MSVAVAVLRRDRQARRQGMGGQHLAHFQMLERKRAIHGWKLLAPFCVHELPIAGRPPAHQNVLRRTVEQAACRKVPAEMPSPRLGI